MLDQTANTPAYNSPYKFNGKELDDGTGMYYYGARYYDLRISVWMSVDPFGEKKPWFSGYVYCQNNPILFIDPDGRDEYEFDSKGKVSKVKQSSTDSFYKVDKSGNRVEGVSLRLDKKVVQGQINLKTKGGEEASFLKIKGDDEARAVFEFLSNNSIEDKTEYVNVSLGHNVGINGSNLVGANVLHQKSKSYGIKAVFDNGYTIRRADHNHPSGSVDVTESDVKTAKMIQKPFPNSKLYNYTTSNGYTPFDKNTMPEMKFLLDLPEFEITGTK